MRSPGDRKAADGPPRREAGQRRSGRGDGKAERRDQIGSHGAPAKRYEVVYRVLREHLDSGRLPIGLVLLEGPIAEVFEVSRAPVQQALRMLEREQRIQRFEGRGYLVPDPEAASAKPLRLDMRTAGLVVPGSIEETLQTRTWWERIYDEVAVEVGSAMAFGEYRILETRMATHFGVSRTVVRDVLGRLQERGLLRKNARSHWVFGPLTAAAMRELYELRRLLEPPALVAAAPTLDRAHLEQLHARLMRAERHPADLTTDEMDRMERDLHVDCVQRIANQRMVSVIRQAQLPLITNHTFHHYLGIPQHSPEIVEHRLIVEHLLQEAPDAAAAALQSHLGAALQRALTRLKVLSVVPEPRVPPFLERSSL